MDSEKRQKMMLVAAAVLSVGAGSYWFFGRGHGAARSDTLVEDKVVRKPRATVDAPTPLRMQASAQVSGACPTVARRKPPPEPVDTTTQRKPRPRPDKAGTKKPIRYAG